MQSSQLRSMESAGFGSGLGSLSEAAGGREGATAAWPAGSASVRRLSKDAVCAPPLLGPDDEEDEILLLRHVGQSELESTRSKARRDLLLACLFSTTYLAFASAMPIFNKWAMKQFNKFTGHPFTLTQVFVQLVGVACVMATVSCLQHAYWRARVRFSVPLGAVHSEPSWIFGPGLLAKCYVLLIPSVLFASEIILSNIGLWYASVAFHVMLRSTSILFVVLFVCLITDEPPKRMAYVACFGIAVGAGLSSYLLFKGKNHGGAAAPWLAFVVNLASSIVGSLSAVVTRIAVRSLKVPVEEGGPGVSPVEITTINMFGASLFVLVAGLAMEADALHTLSQMAPALVCELFFAGVGMTLGQQFSRILIVVVAKAVTFSVISQWRFVISVVLAIALYHEVSYTAVFTADLVVMGLSSLLYSFSLYQEYAAKKATPDLA